MLNIKDIITGHVKELVGSEQELSDRRLLICKTCPIYSSDFGGVCNSKLYLNPLTNDVSITAQEGYVKGCGCRLKAKTRLPNSFCVANKW